MIEKIIENYENCMIFDEYLDKKYEYLAMYMFDVYTYDNDLDSIFVKDMMEVIEAIYERKTFEYYGQRPYNYVLMCNMKFLADKIEWGTSIRGAWFNEEREYRFSNDQIVIEGKQIKEFIKALIQFYKDETII